MKKLIATLLALIMLVALAVPAFASGFTMPSSVSAKTSDSEESTDDEAVSDESGGSGGVSETVLYDENGFKITVKGLSDGYSGPEFKLLLENNSGKNAIIQSDSASVNGYMADAYLYVSVPDGKKVNDSISLDQDQLDLCGISDIADLTLSFRIVDEETYDDILVTEPLTITTDKAEGFEYVFDDSGVVAYEGNDIRIIIKGMMQDKYGYNTDLYLFIENNLDQDIIIQSSDTSVNGFMVNGYIYDQVNAGKRAIAPIEFSNDELEDNDIDSISDIEVTFNIVDSETWDEIITTDPISISF